MNQINKGLFFISIGARSMNAKYFSTLFHAAKVQGCNELIVCILDGPEKVNLKTIHGFSDEAASDSVKARTESLKKDLESISEVPKKVFLASDCFKNTEFIKYLEALQVAYKERPSFRRHCQNQVFKNLHPILRDKGIKRKNHEILDELSPYILSELALKQFLVSAHELNYEFSPTPKMSICSALEKDEYGDLNNFEAFRLKHIMVPYNTGLQLNNVSFKYGPGTFKLSPTNIVASSGTRLGIIGPNGSGKSTILRIIGGHLNADKGSSIFVDGINVTNKPSGKRLVSTVFQDFALFPHLTVEQNIEYPLRVHPEFSLPKKERKNTTERWIQLLGLEQLRKSYPSSLSGGQQQRTAIARALAINPSVALLDEPTSALDQSQRSELVSILLDLANETPDTVFVIVTHDYDFAFSVCTHLAVLDSGVLIGQGESHKMQMSPPNPAVAKILGQHSLVKGTLENECFTSLDKSLVIPFAMTGRSDGQYFASFRSEAVSISKRNDDDAVEFHGKILSLTRKTSCLRVVAEQKQVRVASNIPLTYDANLRCGDDIKLFIPKSDICLLPRH